MARQRRTGARASRNKPAPQHEVTWRRHDLGEHATPGDYVRFAFRACLFLQGHDPLQQAVQVVVERVVQLPKGFKALAEIRAETWRVVVSERPVVCEILMVLVVREVGDFLYS